MEREVLSQRTSTDTNGFSAYLVAQNVRLQADPGAQVSPDGLPSNAITTSFRLSGYFVNLP